jgi:nucleotide-binding universal stress UspA family protein
MKKILVPLDGSPLAEAILPFVDHLGGRLGSEVVLLSVVNADLPAVKAKLASEGSGATPGDVIADVLHGAEEYLQEKSRILGVRTKTVITQGNPAEEIIRVQKEQDCDTIAMSTRGRTGIARGLMGSVTDKVLHQSEVPMLVYRPPTADDELIAVDPSINTVIVPLDGSELAECALPIVKELAKLLNLQVHLIEAITVRMEDAFYGGGYFADPTPIEKELVEEAEGYLKELTDSLRSDRIAARWKTILDLPDNAIVGYADDLPNSFIAMCTRGQSGITRWLLGSVTEKVVREAGVPVLVIPPPKQD